MSSSMLRKFNMIENYIYLYHLDKFIVLPTYPESIQDTLSATFASTSALARSAPIFSYSHSGPRTMQIQLTLQREMMTQINYGTSNINLSEVELGDDYVDTMINELQAIALPKYASSAKMVDPPMVAVRFGSEVYIKGVVDGGITVTYEGPILGNGKDDEKSNPFEGKYSIVRVSFVVKEVDPWDADTIVKHGSFRGLSTTLERRIYKL